MRTGKQRRAAIRRHEAQVRKDEHAARLAKLAEMSLTDKMRMSFLSCRDLYDANTGVLYRESLSEMEPSRLAWAFRVAGLE